MGFFRLYRTGSPGRQITCKRPEYLVDVDIVSAGLWYHCSQLSITHRLQEDHQAHERPRDQRQACTTNVKYSTARKICLRLTAKIFQNIPFSEGFKKYPTDVPGEPRYDNTARGLTKMPEPTTLPTMMKQQSRSVMCRANCTCSI